MIILKSIIRLSRIQFINLYLICLIMILSGSHELIKNNMKGDTDMFEMFDSYFEYDFGCSENIVTDETMNVYSNQVKAFNGGGSGG